MDTIAHYLFIPPWLPDSFLSDQVNHIGKFNQIVLTRGSKKSDIFKRSLAIVGKESNLMKKNRLARLVDRVYFTRSPCFEEFSRAIEKFDVKLLHAHFATEALEILPLKRRHHNLPLITSCYGHDVSSFPRKKRNRYRLQKLFQQGERFLVLSEDMKHDLVQLGCPSEKITIHHLGTDIEKFAFKSYNGGVLDKKTTFLSIGFFVEKKGFLLLLDAFSRLVSKGHEQAELVIVGQGPLKEQITGKVRALGLEKRVRLVKTTNREQIVSLYEQADVFVLASSTASDGNKEGTPTVLIEAQAIGLPVISTFHAGIPEVVRHKESGFLVPEQNAIELADKMEWMIEQRHNWMKMGMVGRRHVEEQFNISRQADRLEKIYAETIH